MLAFCLICACLFWLAPASATAAAKTPGQWSAAVQKRYADFNSLQASFEQFITHGESGVSETRSGTISFRKPLLVRWATNPPAEELLLVTDKEIWQYIPDEELAYKYPLAAMDDKNAFLRVLFGLSSLAESFDITVLPGEDDFACLQLDPHEPSMSLMQATIWLEKDSAIIRRILIRDFYGNRNQVQLDGIKFNVDIPDADFAFTPPPGVEIEDQTGLPE
ncbi:outer membrane lipoprotein chaperone LolA [Desulfovibrio sp. OttesenSCG-928-C06]|nr:outer membrane lipoprotein chaperone LolA [Desulfovibrio sp. OttesenSCG-928-C06]